MSARREYARGEVCRADLQAKDVAAAQSFYAGVFGWRYEDSPAPDGRSGSKAFVDNDLVTLIAAQTPQQAASAAPAQWNIYFATDDAQAVAEEVQYAGGTLQSGPEPVPGGGAVLFLTAPGGGATGVWQTGRLFDAIRSDGSGALAWAELLTPEPQAAVGFFQQIFGHEVTEYPQDDGGTYTTLMVNGTEVAGVAPLAAGDAVTGDGSTGNEGFGDASTGTGGAHWQVYFGVPDVAKAVDAAVAGGAVVLVEPADSTHDDSTDDAGETAGILATLRDPQGAVFSLIQVRDRP